MGILPRSLPVGFRRPLPGDGLPESLGAVAGMLLLLRFVSGQHGLILVPRTGTMVPHFPRIRVHAAVVPEIEAAVMTLPDRLVGCMHPVGYLAWDFRPVSCRNRAQASLFPMPRKEASLAICSLRGRVVPCSQL